MEALFERRRDAVLALAAVVILLLLLGRVLVRAGAPEGPAQAVVRPLAVAVPAAPSVVVVDVVGAVARPGLYRLHEGARIADAVAKAGGATRKADLEQINLAARLADGEQILVPRRGAPGAGHAQRAAGAGGTSGPVHVNTATAAELDTLPGVGPVTAEKIIAYREQHGAFRSVDELDAIPGIGPARLEQLKGLIVP